jgi:pimeloyl-ACP methyl ester carboxylesterase
VVVIAVNLNADLFGRGTTIADHTLRDMANDTVGLMDALGIAAAHVVGASMDCAGDGDPPFRLSAASKAGIAPSRIAREFGISQSGVRKLLASDARQRGRES